MRLPVLLLMTASCLAASSASAFAQNTGTKQLDTIAEADKMALAREYIARISKGFARADQLLYQDADGDAAPPVLSLPEGEELLFRIRVGKRLTLDNPLLGRVENRGIVLSFRDFISAIEFPIEIDPAGTTASGWYIRENRTFNLDYSKREVRTENGTFIIPETVTSSGGDLYVPAETLAQWFGLKLRPDPSSLELFLESPVLLPVQERLARRNKDFKSQRLGPPVLPLGGGEPEIAALPFVDVSTRSGYRREGHSGDGELRNIASIRTAGDFAHGTLVSQTQLDDRDGITNVRANYKRSSLDPELLGPLKARRYEIGDVIPVRQPITSSNPQELGVRVTNIHPLRNYLRPSTTLSGSAFPGWDVELYRENQLIGIQTVGEDGLYTFENVDLFRNDNTFRVILYGPQGEVREETLYIPVDSQRLSSMGSAYDVSITQTNSQTYRQRKLDTEDDDSLHFSAIYEKPVGSSSAVTLGLESEQRSGEQRATGQAGISTTISETLLNLNAAIDNRGEMAAELVSRRDFGKHQIRNEMNWAADEYDTEDADEGREVFSEQLRINGPLPFNIGRHPSYNLGYNYFLNADDMASTSGYVGFNAAFNRIALNQQFNFANSDSAADPEFHSLTTLSGMTGGNRLRFVADYEMVPESRLDRVTANLQRNLNRNLELGLNLDHQIDPRLTEGSAQLNWNAGFARISPEVIYNSDNDLAATLSTRFGLARNPHKGTIQMFERGITASGGVSAFVFLDRDGDGTFSDGDEPIPDAVIQAPQNGGRVVTDAEGLAFMNRMAEMRPTDVYVDPNSLPDPLWIAGFAGLSVIPREGHVVSLDFPVHLAGEIDGTLLEDTGEGTSRPLRGIELHLYTPDGEKALSTFSENDGFYLFSPIPPGTYYLIVDGNDLADRNLSRPLPQTVTIGFEGTTIYGNVITLRSGAPDIPVSFLPRESPYAAALQLQDRTLIMNLGSCNSRMLMGIEWFKLRTRYAATLEGAVLLEKPSDSIAEPQTGKHTLRVSLPEKDLNQASRRCRALLERGQPCSLEMVSGVQKLASIEN